MRIRELTRSLPLLAVLAAVAFAAPARAASSYTSDLGVERCTFASKDTGGAGNPLFPLVVGTKLVLESKAGSARVEITTKDETEVITFTTKSGKTIQVDARVVEERETEHGKLAEVSRNFFARCVETGDVFYFGEEVTPPEGSWRAGKNGAQPGIIMPGTFLLGSRYFQEHAPGVAMDRAEHVGMGLELDTAAGRYKGCVAVKESSELEHESSDKKYCPGVGLVFDDGAVLTEIQRGQLP